MREDRLLSQLPNRQLREIRVCGKVLETMQPRSEEPQRLKLLILIPRLRKAPRQLNASSQSPPQQRRARLNPRVLVRNVVLHTSLRIDGQLDLLVDEATKAGIVLPCVVVVVVVLWVIDVLLRAVAAETVLRDLKLACGVAERQEREDPQHHSDGLLIDHLQRARINCLGVVAQPVSKVHALERQVVELAPAEAAREVQPEKGILDVAVAPVDALGGRDGGNVTRAECCGGEKLGQFSEWLIVRRSGIVVGLC